MRVLLLLSLLLVGCRPAAQDTLILISIDGFRAQYMHDVDLPALSDLAAGGVWAPDGLTPVFPSKTFPNHYTTATGLYPAKHGIVANTMYDSELDAWFRISDRDAVEDPRWWGGEPIWVTAEAQGQTAATFFWVGSEAPVKGRQATHWFRHDAAVPGEDRVAQVLEWLDLPVDERPTVITLYFSDVDTKGHLFGPRSTETEAALQAVDNHIARLLGGLRQRELLSTTNLVLTSDHGMSEVDPTAVSYLEDVMGPDDGQVIDLSPILAIRPAPGREDMVRDAVRSLEGVDLLSHTELADLHYTGHHRIPAVIGLAREGWTVLPTRDRHREIGSPNPGNHGYHPHLPAMAGLFIAAGPAFHSGVRVESFESVHVYNLLTEVAGLTPAPNDGDIAVVTPFLR
ncbi:MAG: alkaline phosphatase family protein [Rhodothermales bacterium]|nr:alkaline phosphatase family protein [Rhodothermales bacterium]MBO6778282.1 alkaline phosphatase family protein [Rhodothermales bacterium]